MNRNRLVTGLALAFTLALPMTASAADGALLKLGTAHMNASKAISTCTGVLGCANAISHSLTVTNAFTTRASARMAIVATPQCLGAAARYIGMGRKEIAAAHRFVSAGGSTATRDGYFNAAVDLDGAILALVRVC